MNFSRKRGYRIYCINLRKINDLMDREINKFHLSKFQYRELLETRIIGDMTVRCGCGRTRASVHTLHFIFQVDSIFPG